MGGGGGRGNRKNFEKMRARTSLIPSQEKLSAHPPFFFGVHRREARAGVGGEGKNVRAFLEKKKKKEFAGVRARAKVHPSSRDFWGFW